MWGCGVAELVAVNMNMNMNMNMGNMSGMGGGMSGMSPHQMQQLQSMARVNPAMLANASAGNMGGINPSQLLNQHHLGGMNGSAGMLCLMSSKTTRVLTIFCRYGRYGRYGWNGYERQLGWDQPCCIDGFKYRSRYALCFFLSTSLSVSSNLERKTNPSLRPINLIHSILN